MINGFTININLPFEEFLGYIFLFGPFLEIIQIPLCLIVYFVSYPNKKNKIKYFAFFFIVFVVKISLYLYVMLSGISING